MTLQEFETRTGISISQEQFDEIHELYMNAGNIDKDDFCEDYKKHKDSKVIAHLNNYVSSLNYTCANLTAERIGMVEFLIDQAQKWSAGDLRDKAISMVGASEYLKIKIGKGHNLWEADKALLLELL